MNQNPTMEGASENLSKILNPKQTQEEKYWEVQAKIKQEVFQK